MTKETLAFYEELKSNVITQDTGCTLYLLNKATANEYMIVITKHWQDEEILNASFVMGKSPELGYYYAVKVYSHLLPKTDERVRNYRLLEEAIN